MIYLYAVSETPPQGFRGLGLEGEPVVSMPCAGLHLAHSFHPDGFEAPVTPQALWAHEGVVDELLERGPVVPFRFGTTLAGRPAAEEFLTRESGRFKRTLADLRGRVELAVRVALPEREETTTDGASYLAARARERDASDSILAPLESLAAASTKSDSPRVIRASYLVASDDVDRFASVVRELQERNPDLAMTCTGPWAPYSFVGERA
jgi:Gas vesicle synthesis protein GvpL/GvpF